MLLFKEKLNYQDPFNVVFLCGNQYSPESGRDKRIILKDFLLNSGFNFQIVLLEENFVFAQNKKGYLAYDKIFVRNLSEVENLAALYADKIIIIHETISTAAELGMFASNQLLTEKICVLFPDDISIEEKKISTFIKLAFFNKLDFENKKPLTIKYYPDVEIYRSSANKSEYHTFFYENKVGQILGRKILKFANRLDDDKSIEIKHTLYGKADPNKNVISYYVSKDNKVVNIFLHADILKAQLLSMFAVEIFRTEFRKEKTLSEHIGFFENEYKKILLNSICDIEGLATEGYTLNLEVVGIDSCKLRKAIGYFLYMLQAIGFIGLEQSSSDSENDCRKITIKQPLEKCIPQFRDYIHEKTTTEFGGII